jgi:uncharacterized protein YkwD
MPEAAASRGCAYQDSSVSRTPAADLRAAVACLINHDRRRWHLPALRVQGEVEQAAQGHTGQMVSIDSLTHAGVGGSSPGVRLDQAGYRWAAWGEIIASGYRTPRGVVRAWLRSGEHCPIMLSPEYSALGVGVVPGAVRGVANVPGTWTVDFGLPAGHRPPSGNTGPANSCPH